jgi:hypothetical protein
MTVLVVNCTRAVTPPLVVLEVGRIQVLVVFVDPHLLRYLKVVIGILMPVVLIEKDSH